MNLTNEQVKQAKQVCKENGLNPKIVTKELGNGFWMEECGGSFDGYLNHLRTFNPTGIIYGIIKKSSANRRKGIAGMSSLTK